MALLAAGLLLGPSPGRSQEPPPEPDVEEDGGPGETAPAEIPEGAKGRKNPVRATPDSIRNGKQLYVTQCAMCHGPAGDGKGDLVERLELEMPDFTDAAQQASRTDGEYFYLITEGHRDMPGEGSRLSDEWKWDLVNHIRTLK